MVCCHSKVEREEAVSRCKARRRYMKQLVNGRSTVAVVVERLGFLGPICPPSSPTDKEWDEAASSVSEVAHAAPPPPSAVGGYSKEPATELAMVVVPRGRKDLSEIVTELDDYFLKAAGAGNKVSLILEAPNCRFPNNQSLTGKMCSYGRSLSPFLSSWSSNSRTTGTGFRRFGDDLTGSELNGGGIRVLSMSHSSTVEKLYAWEKKLYLEVKNCEMIKEVHEKRLGLLRRQEARGMDYVKVEKNKREMISWSPGWWWLLMPLEATSREIIRLREAELFPHLLELVNG